MAGRALDRRRRDGLARRRLRGAVPRRGAARSIEAGARVGAGSSVAARRADRGRARSCAARSCRSGPAWGSRRSCEDAVIGPRARIGAGRPDRLGRRRRAGRLDPGRRRGAGGRTGFPGGCAVSSLRGDVRAGRPARRAAARGPRRGAGRARSGARGRRRVSATISALGGSAIGGSLAEALWRDSLRVPTVVNRARRAARAGSGRATSCVPVSYSGATAETLAAARAALERGADVIAVTAGDPLGAARRGRGRPGRARRAPACRRARRSARSSVRSRPCSSTRA